MGDDAVLEIRRLQDQVAALFAYLSPFVSTDEMCRRYNCTPRTLNNMERTGRIPFRKAGKWNRAELMKFESELA